MAGNPIEFFFLLLNNPGAHCLKGIDVGFGLPMLLHHPNPLISSYMSTSLDRLPLRAIVFDSQGFFF